MWWCVWKKWLPCGWQYHNFVLFCGCVVGRINSLLSVLYVSSTCIVSCYKNTKSHIHEEERYLRGNFHAKNGHVLAQKEWFLLSDYFCLFAIVHSLELSFFNLSICLFPCQPTFDWQLLITKITPSLGQVLGANIYRARITIEIFYYLAKTQL